METGNWSVLPGQSEKPSFGATAVGKVLMTEFYIRCLQNNNATSFSHWMDILFSWKGKQLHAVRIKQKSLRKLQWILTPNKVSLTWEQIRGVHDVLCCSCINASGWSSPRTGQRAATSWFTALGTPARGHPNWGYRPWVSPQLRGCEFRGVPLTQLEVFWIYTYVLTGRAWPVAVKDHNLTFIPMGYWL